MIPLQFMATQETRELAFYYPNPIWTSGDWIKSLVLFFDGIALLVPEYMRDRPAQVDRPLVVGLEEEGLLEIIEPETAVDETATEQLATVMTDIIVSGALDELANEEAAFREISMSRLGAYGDAGLYKMIFEELKKRDLAKETEDGVSIPMHPKVRSLVLVLLSQILRPYGSNINANLSPATDLGQMVEALAEIVSLGNRPSSASVVQFDLNTVTVDLASVPIDEVLDFRRQNLELHKRYMLSVRAFAMRLSRMPEEERRVQVELRQIELDDYASDLRRRGRKAWKKQASFGLSLAGSAVSAMAAPVASLFRALGTITRHETSGGESSGAYSYLFRAHRRFGYY